MCLLYIHICVYPYNERLYSQITIFRSHLESMLSCRTTWNSRSISWAQIRSQKSCIWETNIASPSVSVSYCAMKGSKDLLGKTEAQEMKSNKRLHAESLRSHSSVKEIDFPSFFQHVLCLYWQMLIHWLDWHHNWTLKF